MFVLHSELQAIKAPGIRYELWLERENANEREAAKRKASLQFISSAHVMIFKQMFASNGIQMTKRQKHGIAFWHNMKRSR